MRSRTLVHMQGIPISRTDGQTLSEQAWRAYWLRARDQMLLEPGVAYLNTGSYGPTPRPVVEQLLDYRRRLAAQPVDFLWRQMPELLWQARQELALFLHTRPERIVLTANVTAAINLVAQSLTLATPGEIVLTDQEYPAMVYVWERVAQRAGLTLRLAPLPEHPRTEDELLEAIVCRLTARTRLLFFSHVLYTTGMVLPAARICQEARRRGIVTVVDGAHAPGMIGLDVTTIPCDFYCANLHKWLLAPIGSGFLWFSEDNRDRLAPLVVSWGYHDPWQEPDRRDVHGSTARLRFVEHWGTRDPCPWLTIPAAIGFWRQWGAQRIRRRHLQLGDYVRQRLTGLPGLRCATPEQAELRGAMTAYWTPAGPVERWRHDLWHVYRVEVPWIERPQGCLLRISTHFYTQELEIERLAEALAALLPTQDAHRAG